MAYMTQNLSAEGASKGAPVCFTLEGPAPSVFCEVSSDADVEYVIEVTVTDRVAFENFPYKTKWYPLSYDSKGVAEKLKVSANKKLDFYVTGVRLNILKCDSGSLTFQVGWHG